MLDPMPAPSRDDVIQEPVGAERHTPEKSHLLCYYLPDLLGERSRVIFELSLKREIENCHSLTELVNGKRRAGYYRRIDQLFVVRRLKYLLAVGAKSGGDLPIGGSKDL